jgi:hypothetical protein
MNDDILDRLEGSIESENRGRIVPPGAMPNDYPHLDQWEDHFGSNIASRSPLDDPSGRTNHHPAPQDFSDPQPAHSEHPYVDPFVTNRLYGREIFPTGGARSPDPPDPWEPERPSFWREPPTPSFRGGRAGTGRPGSGEYSGITRTRGTKKYPDLVRCPKEEGLVSADKCRKCDRYDPKDSLHENCILKREEVDRLNGKRG